MVNFTPDVVHEFSDILSRRLGKKTLRPKIQEVRVQQTKRDFVQMYKLRAPEYVNQHGLNPKDLRKVDKSPVS